MPRLHLIERLNARFHRKLTLISAPSGFGKTTLVTEWLNSTERAFTWLSLDEADNDPVGFLSYLAQAGDLGSAPRRPGTLWRPVPACPTAARISPARPTPRRSPAIRRQGFELPWRHFPRSSPVIASWRKKWDFRPPPSAPALSETTPRGQGTVPPLPCMQQGLPAPSLRPIHSAPRRDRQKRRCHVPETGALPVDRWLQALPHREPGRRHPWNTNRRTRSQLRWLAQMLIVTWI